MPDLGYKEIAAIIQRDMPGYRLAQREETLADNQPANEAAPDAVSPDLTTLYRKYFGHKVEQSDVDAYADALAHDAQNLEHGLDADKERIVTVEPEHPFDPLDRGARPKTVVVSTEKKSVIGFQG